MIARLFIWIVMLVGGIIGGYWLDNILFNGIHHQIAFHLVSFLVGVILFYLTILISKNTGRTLAKYGRQGDIKRMETNVLVTKGVYKYMRHPMHLGLFLFPLSIAFMVASPSFILIISPIEIIFMLIMIKLWEEPEAIRKFGNAYINYKKQTPAFCFRFECIKELLKPVSKEKNM